METWNVPIHICVSYTNSVHQTMALSEKSATPKSGVSSSHHPYPLIFNSTIHISSQICVNPPLNWLGLQRIKLAFFFQDIPWYPAFLWTQILLPSGNQTLRAGKSLSYGLLFQLKLPFSSWISHSFLIFSYGFIGDFPQFCYMFLLFIGDFPLFSYLFLRFMRMSYLFPWFSSWISQLQPRILRGQEDGGTAAQWSAEDDDGAVAHPQIIHQISEDRQRHFKDGLAISEFFDVLFCSID